MGWDEPLPDDLWSQWEEWLLDLRNLADVKIQRCYLQESFREVQKYKLTSLFRCKHHRVWRMYLRAISASNQIHCSLVIELSAAVVAVRTSDMLKRELKMKDAQDFFWTDSKVVLEYVNNDTRRFHVFVANRIQRIKDSTNPSQWRHVDSEENPDDHVSRGLKAKELIASNWFTGPDFLWCDELLSKDIKVGEVAAEDLEVRKSVLHKVHTMTEGDSLINRFLKFSSGTRLVKAIARLVRHVKELKGLASRNNDATSLEER